MNDESPENIAENEAVNKIHVFCHLLKQEYGGRTIYNPYVAVILSLGISSDDGLTGGALTSLSMEEALGFAMAEIYEIIVTYQELLQLYR